MNTSNTKLVAPIVAINIASLLAQIVQIGTITPTLALYLDSNGATDLSIGVVTSASWIAILIVYKWVPYLIYNLGTVKAMILSTFISMASVVGILFSSNILVLFFLNFLLGLGLIIRWVVCDTWLLILTNKDNRGKVIGTHETLMGLGIAIGPLIIAFTGNTKFYILCVCIILLVLSGVISALIRSFDKYPPLPETSYDKKITPLIYIALFAAIAAGAIETSMISFLPLMYISLGLAAHVSTVLLSSFGFGGALLQIPMGWLADKTSVRSALIITCIVAALTIISLYYIYSSPTTYAILFVCGGCISGLNTLAVLDASNRVQETQISTSMMFIALAYTIGSILGPIATGYVVNYQSYGLLWISLLFLALTIVIIMSQRIVKIYGF